MNLEMFHFTARPRLEKPSFIIGWARDMGAVSGTVADFLADAPGAASFCQIKPAGFFPIGGVTVEEDVAQFPQSRLFSNERNNVVILRSDEPQSRKHEFLNAVLDLAESYHGAEALYTVNGIASMIPHTAPRRVFMVATDLTLRRELKRFIPAGLVWQGPPHTSLYLLWLAKNRRLPGVGLWIEVPFYLAGSEDFQAIKTGVSLLDRIFGWGHDLDNLEQRVAEQEQTLAQLRDEDTEIDSKIRILEQGETLERHEQQELVEAVQGALKGQRR